VDAAGDGEVLVVLDLRADEELLAAGLAREVVNRVQRLRKKAGLQPRDTGGQGRRAVHVGVEGLGVFFFFFFFWGGGGGSEADALAALAQTGRYSPL
jgi:hypothetical protein